jgi:hypothetical protein
VKKGECLSSIAYPYMLPDWHIIYALVSRADERR